MLIEDKEYGLFIWRSEVNPHWTVWTNGEEFNVRVNAGACGETYYIVGYSSPNLANVKGVAEYYHKDLEKYIELISKAISAEEQKILAEESSGCEHENLAHMFRLCKAANTAYNDGLGED